MAVYFNVHKQDASRRGRGVEQEFKKDALLAHSRLVLRYERKLNVDSSRSFEDRLRLDFVDVADILFDREIESDVSRLCGVNEANEDLVYRAVGKLMYQRWNADNPLWCGIEPGNRFFKKSEGDLYVTKLDDLIHIGSKLVDVLEESEKSGSLIIDMSINRLDYFFGVLSDGTIVEDFLPYIRSNFKDTQGFKNWVVEQNQFRNLI